MGEKVSWLRWRRHRAWSADSLAYLTIPATQEAERVLINKATSATERGKKKQVGCGWGCAGGTQRAIISKWLTSRHQTGPTSLIGMLCNTAAAKMSWPWEGAPRSDCSLSHTHRDIEKCVCSSPRINPMVISKNMKEKPMKSDRLQPLGAQREHQHLCITGEKYPRLCKWRYILTLSTPKDFTGPFRTTGSTDFATPQWIH